MKNKLILIGCIIIWAIGIAFFLFSCSASRSTGITIVPAVAKTDHSVYDLIDGKTDRLIP